MYQFHLNNTFIGDAYNIFREWIQDGLICSTGRKWQRRRKQLATCFHTNVMRSCYLPIVDAHSKAFVETLREQLKQEHGNTIRDVSQLTNQLTLGIICESVTGKPLAPQRLVDYAQNLEVVTNITAERGRRPLIYSDFMLKWVLPVGVRYRKAVQAIQSFTQELAVEAVRNHNNYDSVNSISSSHLNNNISSNTGPPKRKESSNHSNREEEESLIDPKKTANFLQHLASLYHNGEIDAEGLMEETNTFVFAGHNTISASLAWVLLNLATNPNAQGKARREVDAVNQTILQEDDKHEEENGRCKKVAREELLNLSKTKLDAQGKTRQEADSVNQIKIEEDSANKNVEEDNKNKGDKAKCVISMEMLKSMKYIECVIKESLRLRTTLPLISRTLKTDFSFPQQDSEEKDEDHFEMFLPRSTELVFNLRAMHRNEAVWENADSFIPERFLADNGRTASSAFHEERQSPTVSTPTTTGVTTPLSFVPFSAGPRNCIGQRFAMMEMKIAVFYILLNFNIEPVDDNNIFASGKTEEKHKMSCKNVAKVEEILDAVLNKVGGIQIKLTERTCSQ